MRNFYIVPGVYPQELDLSGRATPLATTIAAAVFPSRKGPLRDIFGGDDLDFETMYGKVDYHWTFAHTMLKAYMKKGKGIWLKRVVKNARHAGNVISNSVSGVLGNGTYFWPFSSGRMDDYLAGGQEYQHINLSAPILTGQTLAATFTSDNGATITVSQVFATDSDTTLRSFANSLNGALTSAPFVGVGKNPGSAGVNEVGPAPDDIRTIRVISPEDSAIIISGIAVTGAGTQPVVTVDQHPWLFEVYGENPGVWANDLGYKLLNVDNGLHERYQISFAGPITAGGSFATDVTVNGTQMTIGPVPFRDDMPTTAADIRDEFLSVLGDGSDAWIVDGSNGLQIILVSPVDGPNTMTFITPAVTGGGTPAVATSTILAGIDNDETFEIWVYTRDNVNVPKEKHLVSFVRQLDGYGRQLYLEDAINTSGERSDLIRVRYNHLNTAGQLIGIPLNGTPIQWLAGGNDGVLPTNSDIAAAWESSFRSRRKRPVRIMINVGHSSVTVQQKIDSLCQRRWDCFGILDMPSDKQDAVDAMDYRLNTLNVNSSYSAIYTPDVLIADEASNSLLYIPPSGHVAAQFAYNDQVAAEWFSPAGLNRGLVTEIQGLRVEYDENELEILIGNQVNAIVKEPGKGYPIKSAETLQRKKSALSNINVRRLLIVIETTLVEALDYSIHEPNDSYTRFLIVQICTNFLQPIREGRGLYDYAVVCDERNTKAFHIDMGQANVDVYLKPVLPIKYIQLTSIITKTGAFFQETIAALSGTL
jgi:hypothetical protein